MMKRTMKIQKIRHDSIHHKTIQRIKSQSIQYNTIQKFKIIQFNPILIKITNTE